MPHSRHEGINDIDSLDPGLRRDDKRDLRLSFCLFMKRVFFANLAILHELKTHFGELLLVFVTMVRDRLALSTLMFDQIVL